MVLERSIGASTRYDPILVRHLQVDEQDEWPRSPRPGLVRPARASLRREPPLEHEWAHHLANRVQSLALVLDLLAPVECLARARAIGSSTPPPTREIERICGAGIFLSLAIKLSRRLHLSARGDRACACELTFPRLAEDLVTRPFNPQTVFLDWLDRFTTAFRREHPGTPASRAAWLLRADPTRRWTIGALARRAGCRARRLSREFRATFGVTVHRYLEMARIAAVYDKLCADDDKISAVADDAGYKSPKDFYRAVRNCLHRTPGGIRASSDADKEALGQLLRTALTQRLVGLGDETPRQTRLPAPGESRAHTLAKAAVHDTRGDERRAECADGRRARKKLR
jgi:AraC-like DNA-binding protein